MIKIDNINVLVDGSEYSAKVDIPSKVTTSTKQEETSDIANAPNVFIYVEDPDNTLKIGVNVEVQLTTEEGTYTMICDVVSKNQMYTTLQYSYGMTFEEDDSSDDGSSDDPDEPVVDPVLSQTINDILGTNYDVVNDMSEEEATEKVNEIIYSEVQSFTFSQESYRCARIGDTYIDAPVTFILDGVEMNISPENVKIRYTWYDNSNRVSGGADYFKYEELDDNVYGFRFKSNLYSWMKPPYEHTYRVQMYLVDNNIATDAWANVDIEWKDS